MNSIIGVIAAIVLIYITVENEKPDSQKSQCISLIKQEVDYWSHSEKTMEEKMQQWIACGGNSCGSYKYYGDPSYIRMFRQPEKCMFDMGYDYIGLCVERNASFCKEANLDKFPPYAKYEPWRSPAYEINRQIINRQHRQNRIDRQNRNRQHGVINE